MDQYSSTTTIINKWKERERERAVFLDVCREETLKIISRFQIMVPETLDKDTRIKAAKSPTVPSPVFTSPAKPSH